MLIPIGHVRKLPVTLLWVSKERARVLQGAVTHFDGQRFEIEVVSPESTLKVGDQLLLDFGEGESGRRRVRVESLEGARLVVNLLGEPRRRERRYFPRIDAYVNLEFHPCASREAMMSWLRHPHLTEPGMEWYRPDPFMDFSATGIRFRSSDPAQPGDWLCLRFRLPMMDDHQHYCGGRVVRNDPLEEGQELDVAVAFESLSDEVEEALIAYTRKCQDLVLGLDSMQEE